jgi:2-hydroxy-3-keto-5-methylthiopentenyl-1-phosphate phosphatase
MVWRVFVDFDGTITLDDTTDLILQQFAGPEWQRLELDWQNGLIGSRECMALQVELIRASEAAFDAFVGQLPIDPSFPRFVEECRHRGLPIAIVSDGLDRVIHAVSHRHGFAQLEVFANQLSYIGNDRWRLSFPHARQSCRSLSGTCKCALARDAGGDRLRERDLALLIGDGRSDFCAALDVDFVLAKKQLLAHCRDHAIAHLAFGTFAEAARLLAGLTEPVSPLPGRTIQTERATNA